MTMQNRRMAAKVAASRLGQGRDERSERVAEGVGADFPAAEPRGGACNRYGSDKGTRHYDRHNYARIYDPLFAPLREEPIRLLEIGLLNSRNYRAWSRREERYQGTAAGSRAPSLEMWSRYFPKATIVGFDINDFSAVHLPRCTIVRGDMGSREDLRRLVDVAGGDFDIIIEDASHTSHHQQIALGFLFPHVRPGGMYIVEDLHWQPAGLEPAGAIKTREVLRRAAVTGTVASSYMLPGERQEIERSLEGIALFESGMPDRPLESADALAVIRKKASGQVSISAA